MTKVYVGLDLSLTKTGLVVLSESGKLIEEQIVKSKPTGKLPVDELRRILNLRDEIIGVVSDYSDQYDEVYVMIENLAFGVRNATALTQLAALNYFVREALYKSDISFRLCAPTTLKKFIVGSGRAQKDEIMMWVYKNWGVLPIDSNTADAYGLAQLMRYIDNDNLKTTQTQRECLSVVMKK